MWDGKDFYEQTQPHPNPHPTAQYVNIKTV